MLHQATQQLQTTRNHPHDGLFWRVPVGWQFPLCTVLSVAYCLWHMGDDRNKIGPLQFLDNRDVSFETVTRENADGANGEEQVVCLESMKKGDQVFR